MLDITKIEHIAQMLQASINNHKSSLGNIDSIELSYGSYYDMNTYAEHMNEANQLSIITQATLISQLKLTVTEFNDIIKTL